MRTTVRLDPALLMEAKKSAVLSGKTLTAVIEDALRAALSPRGAPTPRSPVALTTFRGQGPLPGVDLDDGASLLEVMEEEEGAPGATP
jgi:hypothetical protein